MFNNDYYKFTGELSDNDKKFENLSRLGQHVAKLQEKYNGCLCDSVWSTVHRKTCNIYLPLPKRLFLLLFLICRQIDF